jgi:glycine C-acetyltransferase/8-amino-7-oxononanoate synthase
MKGLTEELAGLQQKSLRRELRVVTETQGARLTIDGRSLLNFSSNNYLGLARHPQVVGAVKEVLDHWGAGATSSRLISGSSIIHEDLERALAAYTRREAALLFPTGYMANLGVVASLVGEGDAVIMDRLCHASLVDATRLSGARLFIYDHAQAASAERALKRAEAYRRKLLVTESLFSMNGDFAPLAALASLARRYEAVSMVDDAHALGVWETKTEGWDVVMGTLSKTLGSQGGFVAGSRELIETLVNKARSFIFTTGLSPACVAAAQAALSLVQEDLRPRERLKKLSARLREGLRALGYNTLGSESQIVPVLLGEADAALACADHLSRNGIFAPAIRPPTVHAGECRIRFSVTADHELADIDLVLNTMKEWKNE